jgi:3-methyladenine DNA glycosylase AlkD
MDLEYYQRLIELEVGKLERKKLKFTKDKQETNLNILGISNNDLRKLKIEEVYLLSQENQFEILLFTIKNSIISEVLTWCFMKLDSFDVSFLVSRKEDMLLISHSISNWWHSDGLTKIYSNMLEKKRVLLQDFSKFAYSDNLWQRRLSLTSLIYYSSQREKPLQFEIVAQQIKILLGDLEYYVQKGLGWTLRELYNLYPEKTLDFLEIYIKDISSVAFPAACERVPDEKRKEFKLLRKSNVSNPDEFERKPAFERL